MHVDPLPHAVEDHEIAALRPRLGVVVEEVEERMGLIAPLAVLLSRLITKASPVTASRTRYSTGLGEPATKTFSFSTMRPPSVSVTS